MHSIGGRLTDSINFLTSCSLLTKLSVSLLIVIVLLSSKESVRSPFLVTTLLTQSSTSSLASLPVFFHSISRCKVSQKPSSAPIIAYSSRRVNKALFSRWSARTPNAKCKINGTRRTFAYPMHRVRYLTRNRQWRTIRCTLFVRCRVISKAYHGWVDG